MIEGRSKGDSNSPAHAIRGPSARARAPIDRKTPSVAPLCSLGPKLEASVVMQGTTVADEMAYMKRPTYN